MWLQVHASALSSALCRTYHTSGSGGWEGNCVAVAVWVHCLENLREPWPVGARCRGITRPRSLNFSAANSGSVFAHVCLRKLYVLCSRGEDFQGSQTHLLQIARVRMLCSRMNSPTSCVPWPAHLSWRGLDLYPGT